MDNVYRLLIYLLIEYHHDEKIREHLMSNFTELYKRDKTLSLHAIIEPLCSIIESNIASSTARTQQMMNIYIKMADFSFFWDLANKPNLTLESAICICKVMQIFMLRSDSQYRGVAQKIFFRLISKFSDEDTTKQLMQEHAEKSVNGLAQVDSTIRQLNDKNNKNANKSFNMLLSPVSTKTSIGQSDQFEMKLLLHYLFKHLLLLGRGSSNDLARSDSECHDHKILTQSPNFHFLC